jgi:hypothetical protein
MNKYSNHFFHASFTRSIFIHLTFLIFLAVLFRFWNWHDFSFFGDQAWFYLSARDSLLQGKFPLLGITSSIIWLHQGALFTYLLIPTLLLTGFEPLSGVVLTQIMGVVSVALLYYLGTLLFNKRVGFVSALFLAVSPLAVLHSRMSYHTSPIPLFMLICSLLLIKKRAFLSGFFLSLLYSLHLLTLVFWLPVFWWVFKGKLSKTKFFTGFFLGLIPFILSGPLAAFGIFVWLGFKTIVGFPATNTPTFYLDLFSKLICPTLFFPLTHNLNIGTGSQAYFVILIVPLCLLVGWISAKLPNLLLVGLFIFVITSNFLYLNRTHYQLDSGHALSERISVAKNILKFSSSRNPKISVTGSGSEFSTSKDPYVYLVWWLGRKNEPSGAFYSFTVNEANLELQMVQ